MRQLVRPSSRFYLPAADCKSHRFSRKRGMPSQLESPDAIAEVRIETALRTRSSHLDLNDLSLTSLPESLSQLSGLQMLYLAGNQLTNLPEWLDRLTGLRTLG